MEKTSFFIYNIAMAYNLFIDDQIDDINPDTGRAFRDPELIDPSKKYVAVKTVEQAKDHILAHGCPVFISFDFDLGLDANGEPMESDELAKWLVDQDLDNNGSFIPEGFSYQVHSKNLTAKNNLAILGNWLKVKKEQK